MTTPPNKATSDSGWRNWFLARKLTAVCRWFGFLGFVNWILFVVVVAHWFLIGIKCRWGLGNCDFALTDSATYESVVFYGGLAFSGLVLVFLENQRHQQKNWRMRYAASALALGIMCVSFVTAYLWDDLNVTGSPSATIRDVGLAVAAVLTLFFVIWRERIASNRADDSLAASRADRFQNGARMLASQSSFDRIGGIAVIRELGQERGSSGGRQRRYREASLILLREWAEYRRRRGLTLTEDRIAREAIQYLENLEAD